jgi:hypothetical protein
VTSPLNVNPDDVQVTASNLHQLESELGGAIPPGTTVTVFPTGAATALIHSNTAAATAAMQSRVAQTSGQLGASAEQYGGADKQNGKALALKEIGLGEVAQLIGVMVQPLAQIGQAAVGVLGSAVGEVANPLTGIVGAGIGAAAQSSRAGASSGLLGTGVEPHENGAVSTPAHLRSEQHPEPEKGR